MAHRSKAYMQGSASEGLHLEEIYAVLPKCCLVVFPSRVVYKTTLLSEGEKEQLLLLLILF